MGIYFDEGFREFMYHFVMKQKYDLAKVNLYLHSPTKTDNLPDRDRFR